MEKPFGPATWDGTRPWCAGNLAVALFTRTQGDQKTHAKTRFRLRSRMLALALLLVLASVLALAVPGKASTAAKTTRVSVSSRGAEGDHGSFVPSISARGHFVAFQSDASDLVPGDQNASRDVFVRNRETENTKRVSVSSRGAEANSDSYLPAISANGRFIAFESFASNLVDGDANRLEDIFVRNRETGKTKLVSIGSRGAQGNADSYDASISARGRFVAFESLAGNLVGGDANRAFDVFVRDRRTGKTRRVSVSSRGAAGNADSGAPAISAGGRFIAFESNASTLVRGDHNRQSDVFVYDRRTSKTRLVSMSSAGVQANAGSYAPAISAGGRFIAFESFASNLVRGDHNRRSDVFVHDRRTGKTRRISVSSAGVQANAGSHAPAISAGGRLIAFESDASNLVGDDHNDASDIFVRDRKMGTTKRVSVSSAAAEGNAGSHRSSISAPGRFIAFESDASNLVGDDDNGSRDVFVRGPLR